MAWLSSLHDKWFLKNQNFRQKCHTLLILTGKNASNWLEWCVFRVWGMPNPMVQVSSLYNKEFLKNPNFRIQVAYNGVNIHQNRMGPMQQSSLGLILPLHHVSEPYASTFLSKIKKSHHNLKSTCQTKFAHSACIPKTYMCRFSSLFVHFFPVQIDIFSFFSLGEWSKQPKISHFVDFDWEKCIEMAWVVCLGFEAC